MGGEASVFGFEILSRPSERLRIQQPGWSIAHRQGWEYVISRQGSQNGNSCLVLFGLWTRAAAVPLLIVIMVAIATIKVPELFRINQGVWYMVSDARTAFAMLCSLVFLILVGGGAWSLDARGNLETGREADVIER